jgi:phytoene/squalene synthetase
MAGSRSGTAMLAGCPRLGGRRPPRIRARATWKLPRANGGPEPKETGAADITAGLASAITKAASSQTYYTIRLLVDRQLRSDAYRAYAYFRWVDDVLDAEARGDPAEEPERSRRIAFLNRQQFLLSECLRGNPVKGANAYEGMLVDLLANAGPADTGLIGYVSHMMQVMDFDAHRRGQLVSEAALNEYTRWLAVAVTDAMGHFIGNGAATPDDERRYQAVSGAHILHMLRDTHADVRAGYFNVPRELVECSSIDPADVYSGAYRAWVASRVARARVCLEDGKEYFARVECRRHRLAGFAYIARFEWLIRTLGQDDFRLRPLYGGRKSLGTALRMGWSTIASAIRGQARAKPAQITAPTT